MSEDSCFYISVLAEAVTIAIISAPHSTAYAAIWSEKLNL